MPAERSSGSSIKRGAGSARRPPKKVELEPCIICGRVISRVSDVVSHMKIHKHRAKKRLHSYVPKTGNSSRAMAPTHHDSIDSSSSQACRSPFSINSFLDPFSPTSTSPSTSIFSPSSYFFPIGESTGTTSSSPKTRTHFLNDSESMPPVDFSYSHLHESFPFPSSSAPCSYDYACDTVTSLLSKLKISPASAEPNMEQFESQHWQIPHNDSDSDMVVNKYLV